MTSEVQNNTIVKPDNLSSLIVTLNNNNKCIIMNNDTLSNDDALTLNLSYLQSLVVNTIVHVEKSSNVDQLPRVMLCFDKHHIPTNTLQSQSNGIILTYDMEWKVVSIPSRVLSYKHHKSILKHLSQYSVYYAIDGTVVTAYYYGDKWRLASATGYDVENYTRLTKVTYGDALNAAFNKYGLSFDVLDKNVSYTFGFKHPEFHPLVDNHSPTLWLIAAMNLTSYDEVITNLRDIPNQPVVKLPTAKYINEKNISAQYNYLTKKNVHYGFILKNDSGNYLLESSLMKNIRTLIYHQPMRFTKLPNKQLYLAMRAYLKPSNHKLFIDLFPQYTAEYDVVTKFINTLIIHIISDDMGTDTSIDVLARQIRLILSSRFDVTNFSNYKIIFDSLMCSNNLDIYFDTLISSMDNYI